MSILTGNAIYRDIVRRLPITMPMLDIAALDEALADLGTSPEDVTSEQMQRALQTLIYPLLEGGPDGLTVPPARAGLITTDHADRVRSITSVATRLVGLPPEMDIVGQPVAAVPGL